jgi:hypothetical protein
MTICTTEENAVVTSHKPLMVIATGLISQLVQQLTNFTDLWLMSKIG